MLVAHPTAAPAACLCFTLPLRQAHVRVVRAGAAEYRTSPRASAVVALLEALRIGALLRHQGQGGAP